MSVTGLGEKQYGLIIPGKKQEQVSKVGKSAFAEESDDEDDARFKQPNFDPKLETLKANLRKTTKVTLEKALEEDASVFQYDEVYDQITSKKNQMLMEKSGVVARKPKYVEKLLKTSAMRKLEKELLSERKAQRELEAEKEMFADKESFVTGAYKEKMLEIRHLVEQRKEEEAREEVMDVTKQDGLGGFYRFMYEQKTVVAPKVEQPAAKNNVAAATTGANTLTSSEEKNDAGSSQSRPANKDASGDATRHSSRSRSPQRERHHHHRRQSPSTGGRSSSRHLCPRPPSPRVESEDRRREDRSSHHRSHHRDRDVRDRRRHESPSRRHHGSPRRRSRSRDNSRSRRQDAPRRRPRPRGDSARHSRSRERAASDRAIERREVSSSPPRRTKTPPGCIRAKSRCVTEDDLAAARDRYLARKVAGIHAEIASSDDEDDEV